MVPLLEGRATFEGANFAFWINCFVWSMNEQIRIYAKVPPLRDIYI